MMSVVHVMYMFVDVSVHSHARAQGWCATVPRIGVAVHSSISRLFVVSWICAVFTALAAE